MRSLRRAEERTVSRGTAKLASHRDDSGAQSEQGQGAQFAANSQNGALRALKLRTYWGLAL
jgi:hypothetical protein